MKGIGRNCAGENRVEIGQSHGNYAGIVRGGGVEEELGLGTEFLSEKIPRNRLGMISVIPRKKVLIPRYSEFRGRANSEAQNEMEWNSTKKLVLQTPANNLTK